MSLKMRQQRARRLSDDDLITKLRRVLLRTGRPNVTVAELWKHSPLSERFYIGRFGSWPAALAAAGLEVTPLGRYWSDDELAANLRRVVQLHGRTPIPAENGPAALDHHLRNVSPPLRRSHLRQSSTQDLNQGLHVPRKC